MKVLNLDVFAKANRTITLAGKTYQVVEMTVENFIETTKAAEKLGSDASFVQQVEATILMIERSVPELDSAILKQLSLEQLTTIIKFVRGDLDEVAAAEGTEEGK